MTAGFPPVPPSLPPSPPQLSHRPQSFHVHPPSPVLHQPLLCLNAHHVTRISFLGPQQQPWHLGVHHRLHQACSSYPQQHNKHLPPTTPISSQTVEHLLSQVKVVAKSLPQGGHTTHRLWRVNTMYLRSRGSNPMSTTLQLQRKTTSMKKLIRFESPLFFPFLIVLKPT